MPMGDLETIYDMIIVGGGPAGYAAGLYAARAGLKAIVLEKLTVGGQMALTDWIENYPGLEEGIGGFELGERMRRGAERFGAQTRFSQVKSLSLSSSIKQAETDSGTVLGKTLVLATGAEPRRLNLPGEASLLGKGVSYCATCDGMFYRGKTVVVIGGGNSAAAEALHLAGLCKKVILVHRRDTLRASQSYREQLLRAENVGFYWDNVPVGFLAEDRITGIRLRNVKNGEEKCIPCEGVFISIGRSPATELVEGTLPLDDAGYVLADETTQTAIPGVFAAGDVRKKALRQIVTAVADGAAAAHCAQTYLAVNP